MAQAPRPGNIDDILAYIDAQSDPFFEQLKTVCAQPSISATGEGVAQMGALVAAILREAGCTVETLPEEGAAGPVVRATLAAPDAAKPTLLFYNHYDVQPVDPLDLWQTPPFAPDIRDGKFYARGVSDNKGNWLARVLAVRAFLAVRGAVPLNVTFFVEGEEEMGSPHLDTFLQQHAGAFRADACVWEGGSTTADGRSVMSLGLKGLLSMELAAKGTNRDAHSSLAAVLPSGAWKLVWALAALKNDSEEITIEGFYDDVTVPAEGDLELIAAIEADDAVRLAQYGVPEYVGNLRGTQVRLAEYLMPTCNIAGLETGYMGEGFKTVLPAFGKARLDCRLVPDQDPAHIFDLVLERLIQAGYGDDVTATQLGALKPARTASTDPFVQLGRVVAEEVTGAPPVIIPLMAGSGPMYHFKEHLDNIPIFGVGGGYDGSAAHAPNENVRMADLLRHAKFIATLMQRMADGDAPQTSDVVADAPDVAAPDNMAGMAMEADATPGGETDSVEALFDFAGVEEFMNAPDPVAVGDTPKQSRTPKTVSRRSRKRKA